MKKPSPLTDEQAGQVADRITQTSFNVFIVAGEILGRKLDLEENDAVYEHVASIGEIFKCAECNLWRADSEGGLRDDCCAECEEEEGDE